MGSYTPHCAFLVPDLATAQVLCVMARNPVKRIVVVFCFDRLYAFVILTVIAWSVWSTGFAVDQFRGGGELDTRALRLLEARGCALSWAK